jgi:hypothetical protein
MANSFRSIIPKKIFWKRRPCRRCGKYFRTAQKNGRICESCIEKSNEKARKRNKVKKPKIETQYKDVLEKLKKEIFPNG